MVWENCFGICRVNYFNSYRDNIKLCLFCCTRTFHTFIYCYINTICYITLLLNYSKHFLIVAHNFSHLILFLSIKLQFESEKLWKPLEMMMEYGKEWLYKVDIIAILLKNPLSHNLIEWKRILTAIYDVEIENSPSYDWENVRGQRRVGQGTWKMYNHFHFSVYAPTKLTANRGDCKLINGIKCLKQFSQQQQQKHRQVVRCNVKPKVVNVAASVACLLLLLLIYAY